MHTPKTFLQMINTPKLKSMKRRVFIGLVLTVSMLSGCSLPWRSVSIDQDSSTEVQKSNSYKNSELGFELNYPANWVVDESELYSSDPSIIFYDADASRGNAYGDGRDTRTVINYKQYDTSEGSVSEQPDFSDIVSSVLLSRSGESIQTNLNGEIVSRQEGEIFNGNTNLFENNYFKGLSNFSIIKNDIRVLSIDGVDMNDTQYDAIIESIRFFEPVSASQKEVDPQRFNNDEFGIELSYPGSFVVDGYNEIEDNDGMVAFHFYSITDRIESMSSPFFKKKMSLITSKSNWDAQMYVQKKYEYFGAAAVIEKEYDVYPEGHVTVYTKYRDDGKTYYKAALYTVGGKSFVLEASAEDRDEISSIDTIFMETIDSMGESHGLF